MESNSLRWTLTLFIIGTILSVLTLSTTTGVLFLNDFGIVLIAAGWFFLIDVSDSKYFISLLSVNIAVWVLLIVKVFLSHLEITETVNLMKTHLSLQSMFTVPLSILSFCYMMIELSKTHSLSVSHRRWKLVSKIVLFVYGVPGIITLVLYIGYLLGKVGEYSFFIKPGVQANNNVSDIFIGIAIVGIVLYPLLFVFYALYNTSNEISDIPAKS